MNTNPNLNMDWANNPELTESDLIGISENCGYDIMIGVNNGEEIRRANQTKPWPNDQEINNITPTSNNSNNFDTHEYVDLGLPSGTLWATENIKDASGNELYFAWGETQGYTSGQVGTDKYFIWEDYKFGANLSKYNESDGKTELEAVDDAATANWGSNWKMPTKEQFEELTACTMTGFTEINGVNGLLFTSLTNFNELFLPAAGQAGHLQFSYYGSSGFYWSSSLAEDFGSVWTFVSANVGFDIYLRCYGCSVRPVRVSN